MYMTDLCVMAGFFLHSSHIFTLNPSSFLQSGVSALSHLQDKQGRKHHSRHNHKNNWTFMLVLMHLKLDLKSLISVSEDQLKGNSSI